MATIRGQIDGRAYAITVGQPGQPAEVEGGIDVDRRRIRGVLRDAPRHAHELDGSSWAGDALRERLPEFEISYQAPGPPPEDLPETAIP